MIPKHSNPFALLNSTVVVSRSALRDSDDEEEPTQTDPEHAQMLARLENILKRSIEDVLPSAAPAGSQCDEDAPRKKKRRKVDKQQAEGAEQKMEGDEEGAVSFRLFSGSTQPKPILLAPKIKSWIAPKGPALEDTAEEAGRRASRARSIAVDYAWIMNESTKLDVSLLSRSKTVAHLRADVSHANAPLLLLEKTKSTPPNPPRIAKSHPDAAIEPSPHAHDISESCCPIVKVRESPTENENGKAERRKRRRSKAHQRPPIQATFWRPPSGLGGKALGYAWGYAGSHPLEPGESPHYTRDTMKKAEYEEEA